MTTIRPYSRRRRANGKEIIELDRNILDAPERADEAAQLPKDDKFWVTKGKMPVNVLHRACDEAGLSQVYILPELNHDRTGWNCCLEAWGAVFGTDLNWPKKVGAVSAVAQQMLAF